MVGHINDFFIANLLLSVTVKEFWRSVRNWQSYGRK